MPSLPIAYLRRFIERLCPQEFGGAGVSFSYPVRSQAASYRRVKLNTSGSQMSFISPIHSLRDILKASGASEMGAYGCSRPRVLI